MAATGIVRNIDDLGRIVIPKEIRKNLGIEDGDPLEIHVEKDGVFLKIVNMPTVENELQRILSIYSNDLSPITAHLIEAAIELQ